MGFSHHIGVLDIKTHSEIKSMTYKQLVTRFGKPNNDGRVSCYDITKEIYDLGKYCDFEFLKKHKIKLFDKKVTNSRLNNDHQFYGITKEGFEALIDSYRVMVLKYYKKMAEEKFEFFDTIHGDPIKRHFQAMVSEWEHKPYLLEGEELVASWKYEYAVFELVRIYKSIDWETQIVTMTGH